MAFTKFIITFIIIRKALAYSSLFLPFKTYNNFSTNDLDYTPSSILKNYLYYPLYVNISIGSQKKSIITIIDTQTDQLQLKSVSNLPLNSTYQPKESFTYKNIESNYYNESLSFYTDINFKNEITIDDFTLLNKINNNENISSYYLNLGIKIGNEKTNTDQHITNLITQLKLRKIISSTKFSINFKNITIDNIKYNGYLLIGGEPHEFANNNDLNKNNLVKTQTKDVNYELNWLLALDTIFYYSKNETNNETYKKYINYQEYYYNNAQISPNLNIIIGTEEYFDEIANDFFKEYLDKNICFKDYYSSYNYHMIYCYSNKITINDLKNFPSLYLTNFVFNYAFELTYKDLFLERGDYIYFSVVYEDVIESEEDDYTIGSRWKFGQIFLNKFLFTYDYDNRLIGFYNPDLIKNEETGNYMVVIKIIIIVVLVIICAIGGFLLGRTIYRRKNKEKATELDNEDINDIDYASFKTTDDEN